MSEFKKKQVFSDEGLTKEQDRELEELTAQKAFSEDETFVPVRVQEAETETDQELQLEHVIRPKPGRKWLATGLLATFSGLIGWHWAGLALSRQSRYLALGH